MKKLLILVLTLSTFVGFSQRNKEDRKKEFTERFTKRNTKSPEHRAEIQSKQMTLRLDLSSAQQSQVQAALLEHFTKAEEKKMAIKTSDKKLTEDERMAMKSEALDAQIALKAKMKTILNEEQYKKYSQMVNRKMKPGKRKK
ncbi:hypothetical protein ACFQ1Q_02520 [Winogradskyella litorisediminis]|uniref:LTXXQ motif family protein n=1 Tax=Winogradskyella litorisediminis TaxID=1156618 RepID=A0ABW3N381_9FLAO